jgi:2-oxoglutarate ferredoxin oxidoreductase subunit gamma
MRHEIRLSGSGGQGIILAATLLADAAVPTGREVIATQSYGPEARDGASKAEVIVADGEIDFPEVTASGITVCLSQQAFDAYAAQTVPGDERLVQAAPLPECRLVGLPFTHLAETELGKAIAANIVMLGALQKLARRGRQPCARRRRAPAPAGEDRRAQSACPGHRRREGRRWPDLLSSALLTLVELFEYQGKELLSKAGLAVPESRLAHTPEATRLAPETGFALAVKAQVLSGCGVRPAVSCYCATSTSLPPPARRS